MGVTRRRLFQVGLGGAAVLAAGSGLRWFALGYRLRAGEVALGLGVKEYVVARALVEALCPAADGLPAGVALGVPQRIDEEAWSASDAFRSDLVAALGVLEHCPPLFGHFARFSALDTKTRAAVLERMLRSEHEVLVVVASQLKQMVHAFYWAREETWAATGYDGPWITDAKPPPSALAYRELLERERSRS